MAGELASKHLAFTFQILYQILLGTTKYVILLLVAHILVILPLEFVGHLFSNAIS
jgi:hypothetical protein